MTKQEKLLHSELINVEKKYKNLSEIASRLRSLNYCTTDFSDPELHKKVLDLMSFFNSKYSGKHYQESGMGAVSEVPIFHKRDN